MSAAVTVDLREGFVDDEVVLQVDGLPPIRVEAVRTRLQTGLARSVSLALDARPARLRIGVRGLAATVELPPERPWWIGVSLARSGDRLDITQQGEPFGYV